MYNLCNSYIYPLLNPSFPLNDEHTITLITTLLKSGSLDIISPIISFFTYTGQSQIQITTEQVDINAVRVSSEFSSRFLTRCSLTGVGSSPGVNLYSQKTLTGVTIPQSVFMEQTVTSSYVIMESFTYNPLAPLNYSGSQYRWVTFYNDIRNPKYH